MPPGSDETVEHDPAYLAIRAAMVASYSATLGNTRMPPLEVLGYIAAAVGSLYREVAAAHTGPQPCPCGWVACELLDVITLQQALAASALPGDDPIDGLLNMEPIGHG